MLSLNFSPFPVITTDRLILRETRPEDVNEIYFLRSDPSVLQYSDRDPCRSTEEAAEFISKIRDAAAANEGISWAVTLKGSDKLIGSPGIWRVDTAHHRGEIGYVLHPDFQGKGIMFEAMTAIIDYGFRVMKLHSLEANINPANTPSRKLLERLGFVQEAYFRENYYHNGRYSDSAIFSLITPVED